VTEWYRRLNLQAHIIRLALWKIGMRGDKTYNEHQSIIVAMTRKDQPAVRKAIKAHLDSILNDFNQAAQRNELDVYEQVDRTRPHGRRHLKSIARPNKS
jgi:DNA-binding GntR family transcriptional regulator